MLAIAAPRRSLGRCSALLEGERREERAGLAEGGVRGRREARPEVLDRLVQIGLHAPHTHSSHQHDHCAWVWQEGSGRGSEHGSNRAHAGAALLPKSPLRAGACSSNGDVAHLSLDSRADLQGHPTLRILRSHTGWKQVTQKKGSLLPRRSRHPAPSRPSP